MTNTELRTAVAVHIASQPTGGNAVAGVLVIMALAKVHGMTDAQVYAYASQNGLLK
jgi:hypothetical protein